MKQLKLTIIGMLLIVATKSFAQTASQPYHQFSLNVGYTFSSLKENQNPSRPLFAGNGVNVGVGHRWGEQLGIASRIGFAIGNVDQAGLQNYVGRWRPIPPSYRSEKSKNNWSQVSVMTGPSIKLGKKHQFELNVMGGIGFNPSVNTIRVDAYEQDLFLKTVYQEKDKSVVGMWQVNASYNVVKLTKRSFLGISAGYGSNGMTIGVGYIESFKNLLGSK